ncbi:uncharacterized protein LOC6562113 [Drosophila grimshawi]|uniref:GH10432 n=1 Tax=Drosophila grimshawi TaxID=7222 RepID=B4JE47_DROGR|nr:uncharacterized protein LOC6562113 [Drosophila grimshawi]EDW03567.1 GH10432 [Drosophila grimshawi]
MSDAVPTRQALTVRLLVMLMALASVAATDSAGGKDEDWMAPLQQQYGLNPNDLKNKVQQGDVTTFEMGTPNYQILNPEAQPEIITEDQPHYRETLQRLTSSPHGTEVIDLAMPTSNDSVEPTMPITENYEKLRKRSFDETLNKAEDQDEVDAVPLDEGTRRPRVYVYRGAKPFQKLNANLS